MNETFQERLREVVERLDPRSRSEGAKDVEQLLELGVGSVEELGALCREQGVPTDRKASACWVLGRLGGEGSLEALQTALREGTVEVRAEAARALGELEDERALELLMQALAEDSEAQVREVSALALGFLADERAQPALEGVLARSEESESVRAACAEALGNLWNVKAQPALLEALRDCSPAVRHSAAIALGQAGNEQALPRLRELAAQDEGHVPQVGAVKEAAASAIRDLQERAEERARLVGAGEDFSTVAQRALEDALELAEFLCTLAYELAEGERLTPQVLEAYPFTWREEAHGALVVTGVHPETHLPVWERANRRLAAHVLHGWQQEMELKFPHRRPRVGWQEGTGIEEWQEGRYLRLALFLDDDFEEDYQLGLPADPAPLTEEERLALSKPRGATAPDAQGNP